MKFLISSEHRHFFEQNQCIEFEKLLDEKHLQHLVSAIDEALSAHLHTRPTMLFKKSPQSLFNAGRDLWRENQAIKKMATQSMLAEIVAQLTSHRLLRFGYDQFFPNAFPELNTLEGGSYATLLSSQLTLEDISSIQGLACGLMICLKGEESTGETTSVILSDEKRSVFSANKGNGVFFSPSKPIDFNPLLQMPNHSYFLIVYTQGNAVYIHREHDPLGHAWRSVGYTLGDRLNDKCNPVVFRS